MITPEMVGWVKQRDDLRSIISPLFDLEQEFDKEDVTVNRVINNLQTYIRKVSKP